MAPLSRCLAALSIQRRASAEAVSAYLNPSAKAEWKRLVAEMQHLRIISQLDRGSGPLLAGYGRWVEAERQLKDTPTLIRLPSGYIQPSPWLGIAHKQLELMHKYLSELGLSPVSRSRVSQLPSSGPKPWETVSPDSKFAGLIGRRVRAQLPSGSGRWEPASINPS